MIRRKAALVCASAAAIFLIGAVYAEQADPLTDVQEVVSGYQAQSAAIRQRAAEETQALRQRTIAQLQALQDKYCRNAQLEEAIAVRDQIRRMQAGQEPDAISGTTTVEPTPPSPYYMRDRVGQSFVCRITGSTSGVVWGTDVYTDDSDLATAAVHAGALRSGETGLVKVSLLGPLTNYAATQRHGVSSSSWGSWGGSFRVENADWAGGTIRIHDVEVTPPNPSALRGRIGESFICRITGSTSGFVWGTDVYTDDSDLGTAAVHAGALRAGETGLVKVTSVASQGSHPSTTRNGVTSHQWGDWPGSFRVESAGGAASDRGVPTTPPNPSAMRGRTGESFITRITGQTSGYVWGTDVYTDDSDVATAAVHAGALRAGVAGLVKVTIMPAQNSYSGSHRNGVISSSYGNWGGSFRVENADSAGGTIYIPINEVLDPNTLASMATTPGQTFLFNVTGTTDGYIWGSEIYTTDSKLSTAAVHAAILQPGQTGRIRVTILPGRENYPGVTRHGITSNLWGSYPLSYSMRRE